MINFITNTKFWKWFVNFFGNIRVYKFGIVILGETSYHIKGPDIRKILELLQPGDVLLRRYDHYLGGLSIPGYWTHAAQYIGDNEIIHMLGDGICKEDILTFLRADHICILRCKEKELIPYAIEKSKEFYEQNIAYDYQFKTDNKDLYCSELIYINFQKHKSIIFDKYVLPDDIYCKLFNRIWMDELADSKFTKFV